MSSTRHKRGASSRGTLVARLTSPKITRFAFLLRPSPPRVSICNIYQPGNRYVATSLTLFWDRLAATPVLLFPFFCTPCSCNHLLFCLSWDFELHLDLSTRGIPKLLSIMCITSVSHADIWICFLSSLSFAWDILQLNKNSFNVCQRLHVVRYWSIVRVLNRDEVLLSIDKSLTSSMKIENNKFPFVHDQPKSAEKTIIRLKLVYVCYIVHESLIGFYNNSKCHANQPETRTCFRYSTIGWDSNWRITNVRCIPEIRPCPKEWVKAIRNY